MERPIIKVHSLSKAFGDHKILQDLDLEIKKGEIFGLVGRSGSGKTTLLNLLIGFLEPTTGEVSFYDKNYMNVEENAFEIKKKFGFASQTPSFYSRLTARENLDYFGSLYNLPKEARSSNMNVLLKLVDLEDSADITAQNMSGGMQRRLDIACSLIHNPDVLILDEPTSDLDPLLSRHIWNLIKRINSRGTTIIVASHQFSEVETVCDRIGILFEGKLEHVGKITDITKKYAKGKLIHLETYPGNYDKLSKELHDPRIKNIDNRGKEMIIKADPAEEALPVIFRKIREQNETLLSARIERISLHEVFTEISRK